MTSNSSIKSCCIPISGANVPLNLFLLRLNVTILGDLNNGKVPVISFFDKLIFSICGRLNVQIKTKLEVRFLLLLNK